MDKKNITFIKINGRRYNPETGQLLDVEQTKTTQPTPHTPTTHTKKVMDVRRPARHVKAHQPEHAKTLMRTAVKKPTTSLRHQLKAITRTDILAKNPVLAVSPKLSVQRIDPKRLARAERIAKSKLVHRFAPFTAMGLQPGSTATLGADPRISAAVSTHATSVALPVESSMDIFERALAHADAHEQPRVNPKKLARKARKQVRHAHRANRAPIRHRTVSAVTASVAVLVLTGFIAYQNKNSLILHYASAEAGFHASLPGYRPSGFAIGTFQYSAGEVSMAFHNNRSNQSFTLTQKQSDWGSQTLLDNALARAGTASQTLQSSGRTIYLYNNQDAIWANNNVVYQLSNQGNLSTAQILDIATSM